MKITKRIAEEQFCFIEIEFDSLDEYKKEYPEFVKAYFETKKNAKEIQNNLIEPF